MPLIYDGVNDEQNSIRFAHSRRFFLDMPYGTDVPGCFCGLEWSRSSATATSRIKGLIAMILNNNGVISASMQTRLAGITSAASATPRQRFTNAELLSRARSGASAAVRSNAALALRQRIVGIVWSIAAVHVGLTNEDREDVTQDTLLKLIASPTILDPHPAYIKRIVANILIDRHRHAASRGLVCKVSNSDEVLSVYAESAAAVCEPADENVSVENLLSLLNDRERTVVASRIEGKSHAAIADALGVSSPSVRKLHERAITKLRKGLHCDLSLEVA